MEIYPVPNAFILIAIHIVDSATDWLVENFYESTFESAIKWNSSSFALYLFFF